MKIVIISIMMSMVSAKLDDFCTTKYCSSCQKALARGLQVSRQRKRVCRILISRPGCCVHALEQQNGIDF